MMKDIYTSQRYFVTFDYFVSHRQLLLRSLKDDDSDNIDIIFFNVSFISGPTNFRGLELFKAGKSSLQSQEYFSKFGATTFQINSEGYTSFILADLVKIYENQLSFNETSLGLQDVRGRANQIFAL